MTLLEADRAATTAVTHAMAVGVTTLLITGLLIGSNQMVEDRRQLVTERGLEDIGSAIVSEVLRLDRFNTTQTNVSFTTTHPERIAGHGYSVVIRDHSSSPPPYRYALSLNTSDPSVDADVPVRFRTDTPVCTGAIGGGTIVVEYDNDPATPDCIRLSNP